MGGDGVRGGGRGGEGREGERGGERRRDGGREEERIVSLGRGVRLWSRDPPDATHPPRRCAHRRPLREYPRLPEVTRDYPRLPEATRDLRLPSSGALIIAGSGLIVAEEQIPARDEPRLAEIDRDWPRLAEIGRG